MYRATVVFLLAVTACGETPAIVEPPDASVPFAEHDAGTTDAGQPIEPLVWQTCAVPLTSSTRLTAQCSTVELPVNYAQPDAGTLPVFVARSLSSLPNAAQLWFLNGGPGAPGTTWAPVVKQLQSLGLAFDMYMPDHRGTGNSGFLECPAAQDEPQCGVALKTQWGSRLDGFSTTGSALDVAELIRRTRAPNQKVFVLGNSYGSYWAHRYMQVAPTQADGVVMAGNCLSSTCRFEHVDENDDEAGKAVLDACAKDTVCAAKLGPDPVATFRALLDKMPAGHCAAAGMNRNDVRAIAAVVGVNFHPLLPAFIYRLNRCSTADVTAIEHLVQQAQTVGLGGALARFGPEESGGFSYALQNHVAASELYTLPPKSRAALRAIDNPLLFSVGLARQGFDWVMPWPRYPRDEFIDGWTTSETPLLMMNGDFDFQTPLSLSLAALTHLPAKNLQFFTVHGQGHRALFSSQCTYSLVTQFLNAPTAKVDASCLEALPAVDFSPTGSATQLWLGTDNAWD